MLVVDLYSGSHCSLCTDAKELLLKFQKEKPFLLKEIKIKPTDTFFEEFRNKIPVILVNGTEKLSGKISESDLKNILLGES